jgi:hypothetical protein
MLSTISPRFGTVTGGTSVTFSGTGLSATQSDYSILIDNVLCPVTASSTTQVTCTTAPRPGLVESSLSISINGVGRVSTHGKLFRYVSMWSDDTTWGGEYAPVDGESIYVPKGLNLYVDIDDSPLLNLVSVEGGLILAPDSSLSHHRHFDARFIMVTGGYMQVGTEEFPYTSKITITLHGGLYDPYIPIYGNKVIGVRYGVLDMHGPARTPVWSSLENTAAKGAS